MATTAAHAEMRTFGKSDGPADPSVQRMIGSVFALKEWGLKSTEERVSGCPVGIPVHLVKVDACWRAWYLGKSRMC